MWLSDSRPPDHHNFGETNIRELREPFKIIHHRRILKFLGFKSYELIICDYLIITYHILSITYYLLRY